jgi:hypothetical protein
MKPANAQNVRAVSTSSRPARARISNATSDGRSAGTVSSGSFASVMSVITFGWARSTVRHARAARRASIRQSSVGSPASNSLRTRSRTPRSRSSLSATWL